MIQLLEKEDYVRLGANDLVKKAIEVIRREEEEANNEKRTNIKI